MAAWPAVAASQGSRDDFSQGNGGPSSHSLGSNVSAWRETRKTGKGPGTSMEQTCSKSTDDVRQSCAICPRRIFDSFRLFVDHTRPSHLTVTLLLRRATKKCNVHTPPTVDRNCCQVETGGRYVHGQHTGHVAPNYRTTVCLLRLRWPVDQSVRPRPSIDAVPPLPLPLLDIVGSRWVKYLVDG
jgi:hypothetical protein